MENIGYIFAIIFFAMLVMFLFEHKHGISKIYLVGLVSVIFLGVLSILDPQLILAEKDHITIKITDIVLYLMLAMVLVEFLNHYQCFTYIKHKVFMLGLKDKQQVWLLSAVTAILSGIIDNLTVSVIMSSIAPKFFKG